jgi:hypothetical protein
MNSKWHLFISFIKSLIRIVGIGVSLIYSQWSFLAIGLGVAEVLGILEEIGDKRN